MSEKQGGIFDSHFVLQQVFYNSVNGSKIFSGDNYNSVNGSKTFFGRPLQQCKWYENIFRDTITIV